MAKEIKAISLLDILPENLRQDKKVKAAALALDKELQSVTQDIDDCLILPGLDTLPEAIIDLLAWQWHVDFYEPVGLSIERKRNMVRKSISVHRHKGTPYAVQEVVSAVLDDAKVLENWEYGGEPYHFKVGLIKGPMAGDKTITQLVNAVNAAKNTRSWLDGVEFIRNIDQTIFFGGTVLQHKTADIGLPKFSMPDIDNRQYFSGVQYIHKEVIING